MRNASGERGQVLPFVAICLTVLMGFTAFAVDAGYLRYQQRLQQTAADDAALAGANELLSHPSQYQNAAWADATRNGFTDNGSTNRVFVNWAPQSGVYQGDTNAVEVIVQVQRNSFFAGVIGAPQTTVTTRAVARVQPAVNPACFYVLNGQLNINSVHANLNLPTCGVLDNGDIKGQNGTVVATYLAATGWVTNGKNFSSTTQILQNIPPFSDPCSTIPGCAAMVSAFTANANGPYGVATAPTTTVDSSSGYQVLSPGNYTSWPTVTSGNTLCLQAGLYVIANAGTTYDLVGPGLSPLSGGAACPGNAGDGVTIVAPNGGVGNGSNSNLEASAPVTGYSSNCNASNTSCVNTTSSIPGVLYYVSCTCTMPWNFSSNSLLGMMYFPNVHINLNGSSSSLNSTFLVFNDVIGNGLDLNVPPSGNGPQLTQAATLVE